jgi:hypothetical protein
LSAAEQQAFEEATAVVLAYRQTITDLYSGARTDLNDLDDVATGELLDKGLMNIQQGLAQGGRNEPQGAQLSLASATPLDVDLDGESDTVVIRACIDATTVTVVDPDGLRKPGVREMADYTVIRTTYLAPPGWAVSRVTGDEDPEARRC